MSDQIFTNQIGNWFFTVWWESRILRLIKIAIADVILSSTMSNLNVQHSSEAFLNLEYHILHHQKNSLVFGAPLFLAKSSFAYNFAAPSPKRLKKNIQKIHFQWNISRYDF